MVQFITDYLDTDRRRWRGTCISRLPPTSKRSTMGDRGAAPESDLRMATLRFDCSPSISSQRQHRFGNSRPLLLSWQLGDYHYGKGAGAPLTGRSQRLGELQQPKGLTLTNLDAQDLEYLYITSARNLLFYLSPSSYFLLSLNLVVSPLPLLFVLVTLSRH